MFEFVRTHNRLLQGLLVLLIFPSFVFFGVQGYSSFVSHAATTVAKVDGVPIKQQEWEAAHRQQIDRLRQQAPNIDIKLLDTPEMKRQTLDALVRERVMLTAAVREHLVVTDERLQRLFVSDPQYAQLRNPDGSVNKDFLSARGMNSAMFAEQLRQDYAMRQLFAPLQVARSQGTTVARSAAAALLERRELQVLRFDAKEHLSAVHPTEADVEAYYKSHTEQFRSTEEAVIEFAVLDLDALKKQISVSDDDLRKYYKENINRYTSAEERRASHILIVADKDAPAAERSKAKAKADALLLEARKNPAGFADLARKNSGDAGSAEQGGDLDFFGRGAMVKPFEDAAFAMKAGEISEVVASDFGFHIIKLTATRGGESKSFDLVRSEILDEVGKQLARTRYAEAAEQFTNMVYEQSDSLQPVLDKLKLVKQSATVRRTVAQGSKGSLASPKLLEAVFSSESVKNHRNTEAVETGANQLVSARVVEYRPERILPLTEVREAVLEQVRQEQALAAARKDGTDRLAAARGNPAENLGVTLTLSRTQSQAQPRAVIDAALAADLSKGPAWVGVDLGAQGFAVMKVLKVVSLPEADPEWAQAKGYVEQARNTAEASAYYEALKRRYKVEVTPSATGLASESAASAADKR